MTFRRDVELDPGQVPDRRGRRVRGGGLAVGGGLGTLIIIALVLLSGGNLGDLGGLGVGAPDAGRSPASSPPSARPAPTRTSARTAGSSAP